MSDILTEPEWEQATTEEVENFWRGMSSISFQDRGPFFHDIRYIDNKIWWIRADAYERLVEVMPNARRSFLKLLASGFAAAIGVKIGDAKADQPLRYQGPDLKLTHPYPIFPPPTNRWATLPTTAVEIQYEINRWTRQCLEAGTRVELASSGHEPDVKPFHYPAGHGSTK